MNKNKKLVFAFLGLFAFHMAVSAGMSAVARSTVLASQHNGAGLWNFALDSFDYHQRAAYLAMLAKTQSVSKLWTVPAASHPFHVKLVGFSYYLFGADPLSFSPLNAAAWTLSALLVYSLAGIFAGGAGRGAAVAAVVYGLWPSNLMLGSQLMKDPFFNLGVLAFTRGYCGLLQGNDRKFNATLITSGMFLSGMIRKELLGFLVISALAAIIITAIKDRDSLYAAIIPVVLSLAMIFLPAKIALAEVPSHPDKNARDEARIEADKEKVARLAGLQRTPELDMLVERWLFKSHYNFPEPLEDKERMVFALAEEHERNLPWMLERLMSRWEEVGFLPLSVSKYVFGACLYRDTFLTFYLQPKANCVDTTVVFRSLGDIIRYSPRGFEIAYFAPFPIEWIEKGINEKSAVKIASGVEMIVLYIMYAGFAFQMLGSSSPGRVRIWIVIFLLITIWPLGMFIPNIGTLYRMRFVYLAPVIASGACWWTNTISGIVHGRFTRS
ncbi:MAG: hypothetical protein HZB29_01180 [Nitrospinae bacterium]|nr:hypothetical protein [Nitrospinota bacterium]